MPMTIEPLTGTPHLIYTIGNSRVGSVKEDVMGTDHIKLAYAYLRLSVEEADRGNHPA